MKKTENGINAIDLKQMIQAKVLNATSGLSPAEEIAYYQKAARNGPFKDLLKRIESKDHAKAKES